MRTHRVWSAAALSMCAAATLALDHPLGHAQFYPSSERPIGWRGDGNGYYPGADPVLEFADGTVQVARVETLFKGKVRPQNLPSITGGKPKNVVWKTRLSAWAHAQPIIVGDKVFTMAEPHHLLCLDMHTGKVLWERPNNVFAIMGRPSKEADALEEFIHRVYCARIPIAGHVGNYQRLPTPWKKSYVDPVCEDIDLSIAILQEAVPTSYGKHAQEAIDKLQSLQAHIRSLPDGDRKKAQSLGGELASAVKNAVNWINKQFKVPALSHWDSYMGWTFATPCSDGKRVYASIGQGQVVAYDLQGKRLWAVHIPYTGVPKVGCRHVPSPMLTGDVLVVQGADQLAGVDVESGKVLWLNPEVCVGHGYRVASHKALRLKSGRWAVVTSTGMLLDPKTGKVLVDFGLPCYGSEGAGASITGWHAGSHAAASEATAFIIGSESKKSTVFAAFQFIESGKQVSAKQLFKTATRGFGASPVVTQTHAYFLNDKRDCIFSLRDGKALGPSGTRDNGICPIIAGKAFFSLGGDGRRNRIDGRNDIPVFVAQVSAAGGLSMIAKNQTVDVTAIPPDWRVERYAPQIHQGLASYRPALGSPNRFWERNGGIPTGPGTGGFCASGNRIVIRTISDLICIGKAGSRYNWSQP